MELTCNKQKNIVYLKKNTKLGGNEMKKSIVLILSLLMVLSIVACGTQTTTDENGKNDEKTENVGKNETETSKEAEDESSFDTSWASNDFEKLLPELPFTGWTTSQTNDNTYKMELQGLNTSAATNPSDSGEEDGADKNKLITYLNSLSDYGFTIEETGAGFKWLVKDADGNQMEFMCGDGYLGIEIQKVQ